jgi:hypothetical protein
MKNPECQRQARKTPRREGKIRMKGESEAVGGAPQGGEEVGEE